MKRLSFITLIIAGIPAVCLAGPRIDDEARARARAIVSQMTLQEKCTLIHGDKNRTAAYDDGFHIFPIERLGIPEIRMADGPQGVRNKTRSTYYPCGISLAASWNKDIVHGVGSGIGTDARARGVAIMLCPGVNIYRAALCGRNFEYYGEDPYLASETALAYITGIQEKGVMSTIKHFALNNQEYDRHSVSSNADERTMNEIYFPAFRKAVVQGDVACVMTSYNPVNGTHAAENPWLIRDNLRKWGFEGIVMSDWTSTYSSMGSLTSGLDLEMPRGYVSGYENVKTLVDNGVIDERFIDEKCVHILQTVISYGFLDNPVKDETIPEDSPYSRACALAAALEGPVMLKNDSVLPLRKSSKKIIVLGPNAMKVPFGGGSGAMNPIEGRNTTLYSGLAALKGYNVEAMDWENPDMEAIRRAHAVILGVGFDEKSEGEYSDRTYSLPEGQDELICKVAEANRNTVAVVYSGGEVDVNLWIGKVGALIMAWYPGQEGGTALADLLSGKASPSGRLPFTFWGTLEKNPAYESYAVNSPIDRKSKWHLKYPFAEYREGIFLGYRGMEHFGVQPEFPFGFGLTYSSFGYSGLSVEKSGDGVDVTFTVTNTGKSTASEVAQVYVSQPGSPVVKPSHELKGYVKTRLAPKESARVTVHIPYGEFSHYDPVRHDWVRDFGQFRIMTGASACDIRLETVVDL